MQSSKKAPRTRLFSIALGNIRSLTSLADVVRLLSCYYVKGIDLKSKCFMYLYTFVYCILSFMYFFFFLFFVVEHMAFPPCLTSPYIIEILDLYV